MCVPAAGYNYRTVPTEFDIRVVDVVMCGQAGLARTASKSRMPASAFGRSALSNFLKGESGYGQSVSIQLLPLLSKRDAAVLATMLLEGDYRRVNFRKGL